MKLSETSCFSVTNHPVEEIESMMLVFGVSGGPQPVNSDGKCSHDNSGGNTAADVGMKGEERGSDADSKKRWIEVGVEGPVEMCGDGGIDMFIEINLILINLSNFLFPLKQL